MKKSIKWLDSGVWILKILLLFPCIVCAQIVNEPHLKSKNNRATDSVYVGPGFYYLKNKVNDPFLHVEPVLKRADAWIVYMPEQYTTTSFALKPIQDDSWKFSPQFNPTTTRSQLKISTRNLNLFLAEFGEKILVQYIDTLSNSLIISIRDPGLTKSIYSSTLVTFVDEPGVNAVEESLNSAQDISVNAIAAVHDEYPLIAGEGLTSSVKENTMDNEDIDLRGRIVPSDLASPVISLHANQMATIIAGGANTAPTSKGIAWKSEVTSSSFDVVFPDALEKLKSLGVTVQNHSYGTQIENYYGAEARAYDLQTNEDPILIHVFSSGNRGTEVPSNGNFAGIGTYANMTGNFKMAKNVIIAGAHYEDFSVDDRNSRGPAYDGRLKPEVVAFGQDGTSDGAAIVSGISLLIQDAYQKKFAELPESALVKSLLITGADDILQSGIDYRTGYGAVNALTTLRIVEKGNIFEGVVGEGNEFESALDVPAGVKSLRLSLVWNDPAAASGSDRALVNDLDLTIIDPDGRLYKPWILSTYPHSDSLAKLPRRAVDKLNNAELITIETPKAGQYLIKVTGSELEGPQDFFLTYLLQPENYFEWTYPNAIDAVESGTEINIRWATTFEESASVEISISGKPYEEILSSVNLASRVSKISLPEHNGELRLRMKIGTQYFYSDPIIVSDPQRVEIGFNCNESFLLTWPRSQGATTYRLYALGEKYLEPMLNTVDTSVVISKSPESSFHYAVAPVFEGKEGYRSLAYDIRSQGVDCYFKTLAATPAENGMLLNLTLSTLYNVEKVIFYKVSGENSISIHSVSPVTFEVAAFDELSAGGIYNYKAEILLKDGTRIFTPLVSALFSNESTYLLFPNPVHTSQSLRVLTDGNDLAVTIVDLQGRVISRHVLPNSFMEFSVEDLSPGLYVYRIERKNKRVASGRLLVLR